MPPLAEKFISGQKKIAATNTAEQVTTTSTPIIGAVVKAKKGNAENVKIGGSEVGATSYELEASESLEFDIIDLSRVFIFGKENDVVLFFGITP